MTNNSHNAPSSLKEALHSATWAPVLTPEQMARVEADTYEVFVAKGGFVCRKGEEVDHWVGIVSGMVKMNNFSPTGKSVTFTGVPPGGWFGEGSLLKNEPRKYDAMALSLIPMNRTDRPGVCSPGKPG